MAYSEVPDLLIGDLPLGLVEPAKFVKDASDEIDSRIGPYYSIPIDVSNPGAEGKIAKHSALVLKRINNNLASGRLIMLLALAQEDNTLHAYGRSLVRDAYTELTAIVTGELVLDGVERTPTLSDDNNAPTTVNVDATSAVETFYDEIMGGPFFPVTVPRIGPLWRPGS